MAENFYTILTATGKAKLANSAVLGSKVNFKTLKVGDGKGAYYEPAESQTSLVNEVWSGDISSISVDEKNLNWIVAETLIPATIGGFFIREAGIFDGDGDLIAISKLSETYKPVVSEGSIKDLCIKIVLEVSNVESVTLKIDPTIIVATKKDIEYLESELKKDVTMLESEIQELRDEISNDNEFTQSINFGMNNVIKNNSKNTVSPKFTIKGKTVINLLGKDGNCEDKSKWYNYQSTSTLDSDNKVFGINSIKITLTSISGNITNPISKYNLDISKYYLISAYLKNGNSNGIQIMKDSNGGASGSGKSSITVTDTSKFIRVGVVVQPSEIASGNNITINATGSSGQYAYVDGIAVYEITGDEYALGVDTLLANYPYVDSYTCLTNPYIEVRHDNLVRNGNCEEGVAWWSRSNSSDTFIYESGKFKFTSSTGYDYIYQIVNVKPNTDYYLYGNTSGENSPFIEVDSYIDNAFLTIKIGNGTFNSGDASQIGVFMRSKSRGTFYFNSIMIIEGATAPTKYLPCRIERTVIEGKFASDDSIVFENGEVTGLFNWRHKTLYGKDYDWLFAQDFSGYRRIQVLSLSSVAVRNLGALVKYDGKVIYSKEFSDVILDKDRFSISPTATVATLDVTIPDSDSGWAELINPNNDEVKAFMNGWKAIASNGTRYKGWVSLVDGSCPAGCITAKASGNNASGQNKLNVTDSSPFTAGDYIILWHSDNGYGGYQISSISGTQLTLTSNLLGLVTDGSPIQNYTSDQTNRLNYCKNNIAPGYEGYQLHYKLANPEPINDDSVHIHGDIPKFDVGDNYLYLDSGIVLNEVAYPVNNVTLYYINDTALPSSMLKNKAEALNTIYKNNVFDNNKWLIYQAPGINCYGNGKARSNDLSSVDTSATYTVDYKILVTITPQIGSADCCYVEDVVDTLNKLQGEVNNRQVHDSILDTIVDLSIYETKSIQYQLCPWYTDTYSLWFDLVVPFSPKKVIPVVSINSLVIGIGSNSMANSTSKFILESIYWSGNIARIKFKTNDATVMAGVKSCGLQVSNATIIADCRGRI